MIPALHQIHSTAVEKNGEAAALCGCCQNSPEQLVALEVASSGAGKIVSIETEVEIAIAEDEVGPGSLETRVSVSFRFEQQVAETKIDFGSIDGTIPQGHLSAKTEGRQKAGRGTEQPEH